MTTNSDPPRIWPPDWPDWLPGYEQMPGRYVLAGGEYVDPPDTLVIHSGAVGANVAEYLARPDLDRQVSCHFSWAGKQDQLVQQVLLTHRAWHCSGLNGRSIGVELSGPWHQNPRADLERDLFRRLVADLQLYTVGALRFWVRHSEWSDRKKDPGPGVGDDWLDGFSLQHRDRF